MALPLAPIAATVLHYGAIALAGYVLASRIAPGARDQRAEDALDDLPEGMTLHRPREGGQANATGRFTRIIRLGRRGPALMLDAAALGRIRLRRV